LCGPPGSAAIRFKAFFCDEHDPAIVAHLDDVEPPGGAGIHPVLAFELRHHAIDRALHAERLAAADAAERLLLLEDAGRGRCPCRKLNLAGN
jgi:hypothetical protein